MSLRSKWAAGKAVRAGLAVGGRISKAIRNRGATQPPAHFQRHPLGRGRLAVFPRWSLDPYQFRYGRFATASPARTVLKNSQLTCACRTTSLLYARRCTRQTRKAMAKLGGQLGDLPCQVPPGAYARSMFFSFGTHIIFSNTRERCGGGSVGFDLRADRQHWSP
jgi:hypothetical protein